MNEKAFKLMNRIGGANIALGIVILVIGVAAGVLTIVGGAKLLRGKHDLTF